MRNENRADRGYYHSCYHGEHGQCCCLSSGLKEWGTLDPRPVAINRAAGQLCAAGNLGNVEQWRAFLFFYP